MAKEGREIKLYKKCLVKQMVLNTACSNFEKLHQHPLPA